MLPGKALATVLRERGAEKIASLLVKPNSRFKKNPFQETAVHMLVKGSKIDFDKRIHGKSWFPEETKYGKIWYMWRGGEDLSDATHSKDGLIGVDEILDMVDRRPVITIYLGFYYIHNIRERKKLHMQIRETLSAIRYYLWDLNMALIAPSPIPPELVPSKFIKIYRSLNEIGSERIVLLDPNAEESLNSEELMNAEIFLFGGIVDKEVPRPGITSLIPCKYGCARKKITLRGSTVGVPQVVHKLVLALLKARYEYKGDIEKAIIELMGSKDRKWRLAKEIIWSYRRGEDPVKRLLEVAELLHASEKEVREAIAMSGLKMSSETIPFRTQRWRNSSKQ